MTEKRLLHKILQKQGSGPGSNPYKTQNPGKCQGYTTTLPRVAVPGHETSAGRFDQLGDHPLILRVRDLDNFVNGSDLVESEPAIKPNGPVVL